MSDPRQTISGVLAKTPDVPVETRRAVAWDAVVAGALSCQTGTKRLVLR